MNLNNEGRGGAGGRGEGLRLIYITIHMLHLGLADLTWSEDETDGIL